MFGKVYQTTLSFPAMLLATSMIALAVVAPTSNALAGASPFNDQNDAQSSSSSGIRLNKVFKKTHSRRKADALIAAGRVSVNGAPVENMGLRVVPFKDSVELDGRQITGWEEQLPELQEPEFVSKEEEYIKFWKPVGVTSTTDRSIPGNLLDALLAAGKASNNRPRGKALPKKQQPITKRIFSVGRLDKDSSGLLLLTSDGRVPNAVLRKEFKRPKTYQVVIDKPISSKDLRLLRDGLVITTDTVRQGKHRNFTAKTLPCSVKRILNDKDKDPSRSLQMTLTEGRNRQIRIMLQTLGHKVRTLHRTDFMGIDLSGLTHAGDWAHLTVKEREILLNGVAAVAPET